MSNDFKSALIAGGVALIVAIIPAVITVICSQKILRHSRYESKRIGITSQRMDWITQVRNIFAEFLVYEYKDIISDQIVYKKFRKTVQLIKLYLNFGGKIDHKILDSLDQMEEIISLSNSEILDNDYLGTFERTKDDIQKYARIYLKSEWNRVKFESDPKNQELIYNEETEITLLTNYYEDSEKDFDKRPEREAKMIFEKLSSKV